MENLIETDKKTIESLTVFSKLTPNDFAELYKVSKISTLKQGDFLIKEGEYGESMFVLLNGEIEVYITRPSGERLVLAILNAGSIVGEDALDPQSKHIRSANVIAITEVRIAEIPAAFFKNYHFLSNEFSLRRSIHTYDRMLKLMTILQTIQITADDLEFLREELFAPDKVIFSEGEEGNAAYLILNGLVRITKKKGGKEIVIAKLKEGQFFGELALLEEQDRYGSAIADEETRLLRIDKKLFLKWHNAHPVFRDILQSLRHVYRLHDDSFISVYVGQYEGKACISTIRSQKNGKKFVSAKVINEETMMFYKMSQGKNSDIKHFVYESNDHIKRELQISDDVIVGVISKGPWLKLSQIIDKIINEEKIAASRAELFQQRGDINLEYASELIADNTVVCNCMRVTYNDICHFTSQYGDDIEQIINASGASLVCGACRGLLNEILGKAEWISLTLVDRELVAKNAWLIKLQTTQGTLPPTKPGQHIMLRAKIGNDWVQRSYTLVPSTDKNTWGILVLRQTLGVMSNWLTNKSSASLILQSSQPKGNFILKSTPTIFFAAGIGVTPALAILQSHISEFYLHYSAANEDDFIYKSKLLSNPKVTLRCTAKEGHLTLPEVQDILSKYPLNSNIMLCGSAEFNHALLNILNSLNIPTTRIQFESFAPNESLSAVLSINQKLFINPIFCSPTPDEIEVFLNDVYSRYKSKDMYFRRLNAVNNEIKTYRMFTPTNDEILLGIKQILLRKNINTDNLHILDRTKQVLLSDVEQIRKDHQYFSNLSDMNIVLTMVPDKNRFNNEELVSIELTKYCQLSAIATFPKFVTIDKILKYADEQITFSPIPKIDGKNKKGWLSNKIKNLINYFKLIFNPIKFILSFYKRYEDVFLICLSKKKKLSLTYLSTETMREFFNLPKDIAPSLPYLQINPTMRVWYKRSRCDFSWSQNLICSAKKIGREQLNLSENYSEKIREINKKILSSWEKKIDLNQQLMDLICYVSSSLIVGEDIWSTIHNDVTPLFRKMRKSLDTKRLLLYKLSADFLFPEYHAVKKLEKIFTKTMTHYTDNAIFTKLREVKIDDNILTMADCSWMLAYMIWSAMIYPSIYAAVCMNYILENDTVYQDLLAKEDEERKSLLSYCLIETLRLNPINSSIKKISYPFRYQNKSKNYYLEKDSYISVLPHPLYHSHTSYLNPTLFNPYRYYSGEKKPDLFELNDLSCLDEKNFFLISVSTLSLLIETYRIECYSKPILPVSRINLLAPSHPFWVQLIRR